MRQNNAEERVYRAPGRVNLIGEYTDFTGGYVLPMAIPFHTEAALTLSSDETTLRLECNDFSETIKLPAGAWPVKAVKPCGNWTDYPAGVLLELRQGNVHTPSGRLRFRSNVPIGAGLSSSAALEVATAIAALARNNTAMDAGIIARLCQRAENHFVGSPCGIMDQFVVTAARAGHALMLNTRDLTYQHVAMNYSSLASYVVLVANSGIRHSNSGGDYGSIRIQMEQGQSVLRERFGVRDLGEATLEQLYEVMPIISEQSLLRCRHTITENHRVLAARDAMLAGDAARLGELMTASHVSQREDLGTSVAEIDFMVDTALALPGCVGARLTGRRIWGVHCQPGVCRPSQRFLFVAWCDLRDTLRTNRDFLLLHRCGRRTATGSRGRLRKLLFGIVKDGFLITKLRR